MAKLKIPRRKIILIGHEGIKSGVPTDGSFSVRVTASPHRNSIVSTSIFNAELARSLPFRRGGLPRSLKKDRSPQRRRKVGGRPFMK
jgi:hypothetical protein